MVAAWIEDNPGKAVLGFFPDAVTKSKVRQGRKLRSDMCLGGPVHFLQRCESLTPDLFGLYPQPEPLVMVGFDLTGLEPHSIGTGQAQREATKRLDTLLPGVECRAKLETGEHGLPHAHVRLSASRVAHLLPPRERMNGDSSHLYRARRLPKNKTGNLERIIQDGPLQGMYCAIVRSPKALAFYLGKPAWGHKNPALRTEHYLTARKERQMEGKGRITFSSFNLNIPRGAKKRLQALQERNTALLEEQTARRTAFVLDANHQIRRFILADLARVLLEGHTARVTHTRTRLDILRKLLTRLQVPTRPSVAPLSPLPFWNSHRSRDGPKKPPTTRLSVL